MGPSSARKRKEHSPNCTLLDFFSSTEAIKRARVRTSDFQQLPSSIRRTKREVIIIDPDSDDHVHDKGNGVRNAQLDPSTGVSEDPQPLDSVAPALTHSDRDLFGMPSALLCPPNPRTEASRNESHICRHPSNSPKPDHSDFMFGVSAPLPKQISFGNHILERGQTNSVAREDIVGGNSSSDPMAEFPIGEWAAGDDELSALEVLDSNTEIGEVEGEPSDEQRFCPVCGIDLTGFFVLEAQAHANQCLDATTFEDESVVIQKYPSILTSIKSDLTSEDCGPDTPIKGRGGDLFTVLMDSHKENENWVEADAAADHKFRPARGDRRKAPFYKVLQGMPIAVDAFCYGTIPGVTAYLLTHAHSDHYTNLGSKWKSGPIYCSEETANLIVHMLAVNPTWIHPLPLDTPTVLPDTGGVTVTLIEANHCPGSCLFFFEGQQTTGAGDGAFKSPFVGSSRIFRYLHCGDFRASPRHVFHPAVNGKHIDLIYLDTTYLDPKYTFSPQPLVISACAELARRLVMGEGEVGDDLNVPMNWKFTIDAWMKSFTPAKRGGKQTPQERILVIVGTYSVGKERIVKAIAQALGAKIYCDPRKTAILRCQADKELHALLTADPAEANVHILPLGAVTSDNLRLYLQRFKDTFSKVIGFRPTGWTYSPPSGSDLNGTIRSIISQGQSRHFSYTDLRPSQKSSYNIQIFGVPYSEHSSFFELTCFAMSCDWGRMIPTVNVGNPASRAKMTKWLRRWESEKRSTTKPTIIQPRTVDYW